MPHLDFKDWPHYPWQLVTNPIGGFPKRYAWLEQMTPEVPPPEPELPPPEPELPPPVPVYILAASGTSYNWTGQDVRLEATRQRNIAANGTSYNYTGQAVSLLWKQLLAANGAIYNYTGQPVSLQIGTVTLLVDSEGNQILDSEGNPIIITNP